MFVLSAEMLPPSPAPYVVCEVVAYLHQPCYMSWAVSLFFILQYLPCLFFCYFRTGRCLTATIGKSSFFDTIYNIVFLCSKKKMLGIDAGSVITLVEDANAWRRRSVVDLPAKAMGKNHSIIGSTTSNISISGDVFTFDLPHPASSQMRHVGWNWSRFIDFIPKSCGQWKLYCRSSARNGAIRSFSIYTRSKYYLAILACGGWFVRSGHCRFVDVGRLVVYWKYSTSLAF